MHFKLKRKWQVFFSVLPGILEETPKTRFPPIYFYLPWTYASNKLGRGSWEHVLNFCSFLSKSRFGENMENWVGSCHIYLYKPKDSHILKIYRSSCSTFLLLYFTLRKPNINPHCECLRTSFPTSIVGFVSTCPAPPPLGSGRVLLNRRKLLAYIHTYQAAPNTGLLDNSWWQDRSFTLRMHKLSIFGSIWQLIHKRFLKDEHCDIKV